MENALETGSAGLPEGLPENPEEGQPEKTFTQKELDDIIQRRVSKSERRHARQISELNQRLEQLAQSAPEPKTTSGKEGMDEAPKRADFENYEDYLEARASFKASEVLRRELVRLQSERAEASKAQQQADSEKNLRRMAEKRISDGRKEYADFDSAIQDAFDSGVIEAGTELYHGLIESDLGHKIAYYLAQPDNHAEAERLNELSPRALQRELGKLELKLSEGGKKEPTKGGAKPTMETLEGKRHINMSDPMRKDISTDEYIRLRNQQEFGKRKG